MKRTVTEPATAARLLLAAGTIDALAVILMAKIAFPFAENKLPFLEPVILMIAMPLICLLIYWFVTEMLTGGWSIGRACLMIEPRCRDGRKPGVVRRFSRLLIKSATLGLTGLRLNSAAAYDRAAGYVWLSTMGTGHALRSAQGALTVTSGRSTGKSLSFSDFPEKDGKKYLIIGREPGAKGLILTDQGISAWHATLRIIDGAVVIHDGQPKGNECSEESSTNK
ncbi:MAG: hypothetical protein CFE34_18860, partial [Rhodobacteraceae bacterium PARR1]